MLSLRFLNDSYSPCNPDACTLVDLMQRPPTLSDLRKMQNLGYTVYLVHACGVDVPLDQAND